MGSVFIGKELHLYMYIQLLICTMDIYIRKDLEKWDTLGAEGKKSTLLIQFALINKTISKKILNLNRHNSVTAVISRNPHNLKIPGLLLLWGVFVLFWKGFHNVSEIFHIQHWQLWHDISYPDNINFGFIIFKWSQGSYKTDMFRTLMKARLCTWSK